jgi:hypothetical protein
VIALVVALEHVTRASTPPLPEPVLRTTALTAAESGLTIGNHLTTEGR